MDEAPIKTLLDVLPAYMNFAIGFLRSPRVAFAPYALKGRVQSNLTSFLLAGVAAAYLTGALMPKGSFHVDNPRGGVDKFVKWLTQQDVRVLPLEALLAVLVLTLVAHFIGKVFDRWQDQACLPGTAEDSVNAALGFTAILLPVTTFMLLGLLAMATPALENKVGQARVVLFISGGLAIYLLVALGYLAMSFASVHKVAGWQAVSALTSAFVCIAVVTSSIGAIIVDGL